MSRSNQSAVARLWAKLGGSAPGRWLFTRLVCFRAPYFGSISPMFVELRPGYGVTRMRKRRRVQNHLKTVHALAMGNLCELAAGTMLEMTVSPTQRWIPRGMQIDYLKKAATSVTATAKIDVGIVAAGGDCRVNVEVVDLAGNLVVTAAITMYVSDRKPRATL